jgi:hypothetical protein
MMSLIAVPSLWLVKPLFFTNFITNYPQDLLDLLKKQNLFILFVNPTVASLTNTT